MQNSPPWDRAKRGPYKNDQEPNECSPVLLELGRLVSSLLYGPRVMLVLNLPNFENKKYTADDRFYETEILSKKEPIIMLGFTLPYNNEEYLKFDKTYLYKQQQVFLFPDGQASL